MKTLVALALGYVIGAKTGDKDLERLGRSLRALYQTEQLQEVVAAARSQLGASLHEVAAMVEGAEGHQVSGEDIVARVRRLVGQGQG